MDGRNNDTPLSILPPLLRFIAFPLTPDVRFTYAFNPPFRCSPGWMEIRRFALERKKDLQRIYI
jgi:hypothetical protein